MPLPDLTSSTNTGWRPEYWWLKHWIIFKSSLAKRNKEEPHLLNLIYISSTFHLKFTECTSYDPPTNKQPVPPLVVSMAFSWEYFWCSFSPLVVFFGLNNDLVDPQFWSLFLVNVTPGQFFGGNLGEGEIWISILTRWGYVHWPPQWVPKGWTLQVPYVSNPLGFKLHPGMEGGGTFDFSLIMFTYFLRKNHRYMEDHPSKWLVNNHG